MNPLHVVQRRACEASQMLGNADWERVFRARRESDGISLASSKSRIKEHSQLQYVDLGGIVQHLPLLISDCSTSSHKMLLEAKQNGNFSTKKII